GIVAHNTYLQGADQLNTSFALRVQDSAAADKFVITNAGNVGIGTIDLSGAKFKIAGDDSAVADNYNDLSQIAGNTNAAAVAGKLQIAEAACGDYTVQGAGGLAYGTVLGPDGKCWLDRNLGATQVATASNDSASYGYYYQWGRLTDGHQIEDSGVTSVNADRDIPGHANFITEDTSPYDWRVPQSPNEAVLWAGAGGGSNNPCPAGWHVPTSAEWVTVAGYFSPQTSVGAFNSTLKLPLAGNRNRASASLANRGSSGYYWSGSPSGADAASLYFTSAAVDPAYTLYRAYGFSVRCVKD
ncbi:MAG TPA: FISUMP domain-containing protein, partial [Candidatus Pacearchaeota archaeon]|nr:FISUMP domain-containing protein [Candidatus Pacearchaeota archaeon]